MDKREALEILHTVYDKLNAMTDDQLFDHMMENSPSFRSRVEIIENSILFVPVSVSITQNTNIDALDHSTTTAVFIDNQVRDALIHNNKEVPTKEIPVDEHRRI